MTNVVDVINIEKTLLQTRLDEIVPQILMVECSQLYLYTGVNPVKLGQFDGEECGLAFVQSEFMPVVFTGGTVIAHHPDLCGTVDIIRHYCPHIV